MSIHLVVDIRVILGNRAKRGQLFVVGFVIGFDFDGMLKSEG